MQTYTRSWQSFYPTDTNTHPTHTGPPAVELAQTKKLSCVQLQTHTRPYTSISSSCDKSEKSAAEWGVFAVQGRGDKLYREKAVTFLPLVNDFPFMKLREGCISIQPHWSPRDSIGKWPAVIKQCGGKKHRGIFWGKADIFFFTALNFTRVNKSPKERRIKSTPQPPQFSKTHGPGEWLTRLLLVCGMARWLTEYQEGWHLLKFLMQCCLFVRLPLEKANGMRGDRGKWNGGRGRQSGRDGCCLTGQVCNSTS